MSEVQCRKESESFARGGIVGPGTPAPITAACIYCHRGMDGVEYVPGEHLAHRSCTPAAADLPDEQDWEDIGWDDDLECTHCGGEGLCWAGSDPLGNCPDDPHRCHACNGSGKRKDQVIF